MEIEESYNEDEEQQLDYDAWDEHEKKEEKEEEEEFESKEEKEIVPARIKEYTVLEYKELKDRQDKLISKISDILDVTSVEAACLLRHYGWKSAKLETEWFQSRDKVRKEVGVTLAPDIKEKPSWVQCETAYCDRVPVAQAHSLNCGHWFCKDCWSGFLMSELNTGSQSILARCPGIRCRLKHEHKLGCRCNELIPHDLMEKFVSDKAIVTKYDRWLLERFVEGQQNIKWCINPRCDRAAESFGAKDIHCKCGTIWCFSCRGEGHSPAPCDLVAKWLQKTKSDDATEIWLQARTKECPKCKVRIEKNKACNHMVCTKCSHHFCWLCKGPWDKHGTTTGGFYACNTYEAELTKGKRSNEEKKIIDTNRLLQKYTFYCKHYQHSIDAINHSVKLLKRIPDDLEYEFVKLTLGKLNEARSITKWCYVMSYYMQGGPAKDLFEHQQQVLTGHLEALQDIIERSADEKRKWLDQKKDISSRIGSVTKFGSDIVQRVEAGEFDAALLQEADAVMEQWGCSSCNTVNRKDAHMCGGCGACRLHNEPECRACKNKR